MKKILPVLILSALVLFSCGESNASNKSVLDQNEPLTTEIIEKDDEDIIDDESEDEFETFDSFEAFKDSDLYNNLEKRGITPLKLQYNENDHLLKGIQAAEDYYECYFEDLVSGKRMVFILKYNTEYNSAEEYGNDLMIAEEFTTTVEVNGNNYDVYVASTVMDETDHLLTCKFSEDCFVVLCGVDPLSSDELLQYFSEFELVAYAE